jgi:tRNA synthetases class II (D, K and N)
VINYPKGIKAFYMKLNDDNETVAAMDILVPKIGELIGGSQRYASHDFYPIQSPLYSAQLYSVLFYFAMPYSALPRPTLP